MSVRRIVQDTFRVRFWGYVSVKKERCVVVVLIEVSFVGCPGFGFARCVLNDVYDMMWKDRTWCDMIYRDVM